jgi:succinoglycan biosynthesis protein ExoM
VFFLNILRRRIVLLSLRQREYEDPIMEMITISKGAFPTKAAANIKPLLLVCVCTYQRPKSLQKCIESLSRQCPPERVKHRLIIIDNDEKCSAMSVLRRTRTDAIYIVEPRRGIAHARNRAIKIASQLHAEWIAFIDDDEVADERWLRELMAPEYFSVPILRGHRSLSLPIPAPFWASQVEEKRLREGAECHTAYTHNVRFNRAVIECGLRFDETLGLSGGEDVEFFTRASQYGFQIRYTARAVTYETVHSERLTYGRQCRKSFWVSAANVRESIIRKGLAKTLSAKLHTIPLNLLLGPLLIAASPFALAFGVKAFKVMALCGGDKIARAMGRLAGLVGYLPAPYLQIDGE